MVLPGVWEWAVTLMNARMIKRLFKIGGILDRLKLLIFNETTVPQYAQGHAATNNQ